MTSDPNFELFKSELKEMLEEIITGKNIITERTGRNDFNAVIYRAREYRISYKNMSLYFNPVHGRAQNIADRDLDVYSGHYAIIFSNPRGDTVIAHLERRPKKRLEFKKKPYQSDESFIFGLLKNLTKEIFPSILIDERR